MKEERHDHAFSLECVDMLKSTIHQLYVVSSSNGSPCPSSLSGGRSTQGFISSDSLFTLVETRFPHRVRSTRQWNRELFDQLFSQASVVNVPGIHLQATSAYMLPILGCINYVIVILHLARKRRTRERERTLYFFLFFIVCRLGDSRPEMILFPRLYFQWLEGRIWLLTTG